MYEKRSYKYHCNQCGHALQKNGYNQTKTGTKTKWRCPCCGTNRQQPRPDLVARFRLHAFVDYLIDTKTVNQLPGASSTFSTHIAACWSVDPCPRVSGEIYPYIVIDATGVAREACAIVCSPCFVVTWEHGIRENSALWQRVLAPIPRPEAVVCDGQKGMAKALGCLWPGVIVQRCQVHVVRNITSKLSRRPQSSAGKDLQWLMSGIWDVRSEEEVAYFIALFEHFQEQHRAFLGERTVNTDPRLKRRWWYTHRNARSAYRQIAKLIESDQLFAFIFHPEFGLPRTTNRLEGGINSRLDELQYRHRGMTAAHQKRMTDWYLDSRSEVPYFKRGIT